MRIVIFGGEFGMTGAGLMLCRWAEHLKAAGHEISLLPNDRTPGPLLRRYADAGIPVVEAEHAYVDGRTVSICNTVYAARQVLQSAAFAPTLWWIHEGEIGAEFLMSDPQLAQAFAAASAVIVPSAHLIRSVYHNFIFALGPERFFVVPCGIDPSLQPEPALPSTPVRILSVGTLCQRKRQADLIRAVGTLSDLDVHCILAGKLHQLDDDALAMVRGRPDRFSLTGEIPNEQVHQLISSAHIFALPSVNEAMAIAVFEAAAQGRPLVLSDLGCYRGVWRHGWNCLMHPPGDSRLLGHLLRILATDPELRASLGAAARLTARPYRTGQMLSQLDAVLAAVADAPLSRRGPGGERSERR